MTSPDPYNLEYRPSHYFGPQDLKTFYRSRIKGQIRGEMVVDSIDQEEVPHEVRQPKLHEPLKEEITGIHPWMMGGRIPARLCCKRNRDCKSCAPIYNNGCEFFAGKKTKEPIFLSNCR